MNKLQFIENEFIRKDLPDFRIGDTLRISFRIREGEKSRIQLFEGVLIAQKHGGARETITVRKPSFGYGR